MSNLIHSIYTDSAFGVPTDLEGAGTPLENPYVYDSAARELKALADQGLVRIVDEHVRSGFVEPLISRISFERLR
jgi:hypothetical protein